MRHLPIFTVSACLALGACTVGPEYAGPPQAIPSLQPGQGFARAGDAPVTAAPPLANWWDTLDDPVLAQLETQALAANPDVGVAEARLRQAQAALRLQRADQLPSINGNAAYLHARLPPGLNIGNNSNSSSGGSSNSSSGSSATDVFNFGFLATWEVDLFGGGKRQLQAARASLEEAEASVADAQVSLTAAVAQAYISWRELRQRIAFANQATDTQRQALALMQQRFAQGTVSQIQVEQLQTQIENADAQTLPLSAEADSYADALAVLTGQAPGALDPVLVDDRPIPLPPASVAIGDPAALIQRRPDIRAAERKLAAQTAKIGVAEAARFPRLNFFGVLGIGGTDPGALTSLDDLTALAAPVLQWSLVDFGRGRARVGQAEGARDEAAEQYRAAVLDALRDAEDALSRFSHRRQTVAGLARAEQSTGRTVALTSQRYDAGTTTLIDVLDAQRRHLDAERGLATEKAALTGDYIALQKALGLGWAPAKPELRASAD